MVWLKLEDTFYDHPKFTRAARRLGIPGEYADAYIHGTFARLWTWALRHAADGDLSEKHAEDIEIAAGWRGEPGAWIDAAVSVGLLERADDGLRIHDAEAYSGSLQRAKQKRRERLRHKATRNDTALMSQDVARQSRDSSATKSDSGDKCPNVALERERRERERGEEREKRGEDLTLSGTPAAPSPKKSPKRRADVDLVVTYYREQHPSRGKHLTTDSAPGHRDYKLIAARLDEGRSVEELNQAIDGNKVEPWHRSNGKHAIEFVFRNATKVEDFIAVASNPAMAAQTEKTRRGITAAQLWVESMDAEEEAASHGQG